MASYRYRAQIPARELGWGLNEPAELKILSKPQAHELTGSFIADFCDDHFDRLPFYHRALSEAAAVTCTTKVMQERIRSLGRDAHIVPDPYEYDEAAPHEGLNVLWFGHATNYYTLKPFLDTPGLRVVSNAPGCIPWSHPRLLVEMADAYAVILPRTKEYKSPNRAVESIRRGCFVVAEPHPSLDDLPIWKGDIKEGLEWALLHPEQAKEMTREAQRVVSSLYAPSTVASAWRKAVESVSTSGREISSGPDGSLSATAAR